MLSTQSQGCKDMSDQPHSHLPYGEDGSGYFSNKVMGCYDVINSMKEIFHESIKIILQRLGKKPSVFVIADFGTADGGTSMPLFYSAVELLKELCGEDQNVHIVYEDQATNDFKSLFLRLNGFIPGPKSFLKDFQNIFISAVGVSFYEACVLPETYHIGFAANSLQWLKKKPCNLKNAVHHMCSKDTHEQEIFSRQAAKDWEEILLQRAKEMKNGESRRIHVVRHALLSPDKSDEISIF